MEQNNDLRDRLKQPKQCVKILLLDDVGDIYKEDIEEKIECYFSCHNPSKFMKMLEQQEWGWFERYDTILFDASYVDENRNIGIRFNRSTNKSET